jgi:hypothetical protein
MQKKKKHAALKEGCSCSSNRGLVNPEIPKHQRDHTYQVTTHNQQSYTTVFQYGQPQAKLPKLMGTTATSLPSILQRPRKEKRGREARRELLENAPGRGRAATPWARIPSPPPPLLTRSRVPSKRTRGRAGRIGLGVGARRDGPGVDVRARRDGARGRGI